MRFAFVEEQRGAFPVDPRCRVLNVSPHGLRAFRSRPGSRPQHMDTVVPAQLQEQSRLSLGSYGRPSMTEALKEAGVEVLLCGPSGQPVLVLDLRLPTQPDRHNWR